MRCGYVYVAESLTALRLAISVLPFWLVSKNKKRTQSLWVNAQRNVVRLMIMRWRIQATAAFSSASCGHWHKQATVKDMLPRTILSSPCQ
ncbi:hypothetical protein Zmor_026552 [Zophobas morio]|uniref:Uncharacterized protein n=1 Tax=Zophobas morio TaxID=2755281 RepID=A0AA38M5F4_9CUCU|nr:hypothetical protein Zmor_026552 [Zophobas morio]